MHKPVEDAMEAALDMESIRVRVVAVVDLAVKGLDLVAVGQLVVDVLVGDYHASELEQIGSRSQRRRNYRANSREDAEDRGEEHA